MSDKLCETFGQMMSGIDIYLDYRTRHNYEVKLMCIETVVNSMLGGGGGASPLKISQYEPAKQRYTIERFEN